MKVTTMKKILIVLLVACMLLPILGCSNLPLPASGTPEFSENLDDYKDCYIDVVEIVPVDTAGWSIFLFCHCKLANGSTVWMQIYGSDYIEYFDPEADSIELEYRAQTITFETPVRLLGHAETVQESLDLYSEDKIELTLFFFESADTSQSLQNAKSNASIAFDPNLKENVHVYLDVVELKKESSFASDTFKCTTKDGDELYVSVSFYDDLYTEIRNGMYFVSPVRIYGLTYRPYGESTDPTKSATQFKCKYVDKEGFDANKITALPPVPLSEADKINQPAYMDVIEMIPYGIQEKDNLLYQCVCSDGSTGWLKLAWNDYQTYFDQEASSSKKERDSKNMVFNMPLRLLGNVAYYDIFKDNYSDEKTNVKLMNFTGYTFDPDQNIEYEITNTGSKFDANMRNNVLVYEDIVFVWPEYTVTWLGVEESYLCKCVTAEEKVLWVLISVHDYNRYFYSQREFSSPVRIYGATVYAKDEISNAPAIKEIPSLVFYFSAGDPEDFGFDENT